MTAAVRVLLVEDSADDALLVVRELVRAGFEVDSERVETEAGLRAALARRRWDLVIGDHSLPGFSGTAALAIVRAHDRELPFLFVSGTVGEDAAVDAMKAGASDYVLKSSLRRLAPAVSRELREAELRRDQERTQRELRQSEERFGKVFSSSPIGIAVSTLAEGRYLDANEALLRLLGYRHDELIGRTAQELHVWPNPADRQRMIDALSSDGTIRNLEMPLQTSGGELRSTLCNFERIELGDQACLLSFVLDLTDRLRLEEQLRHSQRLEAVGRLAGGVAHDFNNLLTVILGSCDLIEEKRGARWEGIAEIRAAGEAAARMTAQLLAFSRKQVLQPRRVDLAEVVKGAERLLARLLKANIEIVASHSRTGSAVVRADPSQLEQVVVNLAVNAREAMPAGGRLWLSTEVREIGDVERFRPSGARPGRYALLTVADSGSGMSPETLKHLFEPFYTTKASGSGLGLATVYGIVTQSGGYLAVTSELGHGATFEIALPALDEAAERAADNTPPRRLGGDETILVVEDTTEVRTLLLKLLEAQGYRVLAAREGDEALALARTHAGAIQLLLTDLDLPGLGGGAIADAIRALRPEIRVLYISGYARDDAFREHVVSDERGFLAKPFTATALAAKVRATLDAPRRR